MLGSTGRPLVISGNAGACVACRRSFCTVARHAAAVVSRVPPVASDLSPVVSRVPPVASDLSPVESDVPPVASDLSPVESDVPPVASDLSPVKSDVSPVGSIVPPVKSGISPVRKLRQPRLTRANADTRTLSDAQHSRMLVFFVNFTHINEHGINIGR